jgi:hypothetical protein
MPTRFTRIKNQSCHLITRGASLLFSKYIVAIFDNRNGIYAQPLTAIFIANNMEPNIAPQREICSIIVFMINSVMRIREAIAEPMITHLLQLCKNELGIDELPSIEMIDDESTVGGGTAFGEFTGDKIRVITTNRHPMDVARTLSHELVHWQQMEKGKELDGSDGSSTENEANAIAGIIMRKFAKMYPEYFLDTLP